MRPQPALETAPLPDVTDRATFEAEIERLRIREKAHTREGDAIAADHRRLPIVEMDASIELIGPDGPLTLLDAFEGRRQGGLAIRLAASMAGRRPQHA